MKKNIAISILIAAIILLAINLYRMDWNNLSFSNGDNPYWAIPSNLLLILGMSISINYSNKKEH